LFAQIFAGTETGQVLPALQMVARTRSGSIGGSRSMITLYSYPALFGVADNNGYGLKVFAFLRLVAAMHERFGRPASTQPQHARGVPFVHAHIFDASAAPRGQLPYILDDGEMIGDSDTIIAHLISNYALTIDAALGAHERDLSLLISRMLDDLYWVMSYSRWKDERYWPAFRNALMREHPSLTAEGLQKARDYNLQRYHFQGIGRYTPAAAYARGLADLKVLADLAPATGYVHGAAPTSIDAGIYGFIANIYFYDIETPLKQFVAARKNLVHHCSEIHETVMGGRASYM
jgi:Glutathione S-transferase N-terminal domain/Glutathione S-transferase, C-terminal domain